MNFKNWIRLDLLVEAKQDIVNLGYPQVIADIFQSHFGNLAFLLAKWYKNYKYSTAEPPANWWLMSTANFRETPSMWDLTYLYGATSSVEAYQAAIKKLELSSDDFIDLDEQRTALKSQIENKLLNSYFFKEELIKGITSGQIKDLAPFKNLTYQDARHKVEKKNIFKEKKPLKVYSNGYKWIDVGKKCNWLGDQMKNCGSSGLMTMDSDGTILALFDSKNKPHVMLTYSPNEKRLSGDEGGASTAVKGKYHEYVIDIANFLGASFDIYKTRSPELKIKYLLQGVADNIEPLKGNDTYDTLYKFTISGKNYYTNNYVALSEDDINSVAPKIKSGEIVLKIQNSNMIRMVFNHMNQNELKYHGGLNYIPIEKFSKNNQEN